VGRSDADKTEDRRAMKTGMGRGKELGRGRLGENEGWIRRGNEGGGEAG
jgi:hypothetical protein